MTCLELERLLERGAPLGPEATDHLRSCERCGFLYGGIPALAEPIPVVRLPEPISPVRPIPSLWIRALGLGVSALAVAVGVLLSTGAVGWRSQSMLQSGFTIILLSLGILFGSTAAASLMVPGSRFSRLLVSPAVVAALTAVPLLYAVFPVDAIQRAGSSGYGCLLYALAVAVIELILITWIVRRGVITEAVRAGFTVGLLAGLIGLLAIQLHCGTMDAVHMVYWHWTVVPLAVIAALMFLRLRQWR